MLKKSLLGSLFAGFLCFTGSANELELNLTVPLETDLSIQEIKDSSDVWLQTISQAEKSIDVEHFYLSEKQGEALTPIISALKEAARRGVKVRLLMDAKFYKTYPETIRELNSLETVEARTADFSSLGGVQHSKYIVIDSQIVILGSHNLDWRAFSHIHETGIRMDNRSIAKKFLDIFELDWKNAGTLAPSDEISFSDSELTTPTPKVSVVASPPSLTPDSVSGSLQGILELIQSAKRRLEIQVMTYTVRDPFKGNRPWRVLQDALIKAGKRGVKVKLLIDAHHIGNALDDLKELRSTKNIEVRIATIPEWSKGKIDYARLVHSKYLICDEQSFWIGTENWSEGYFTSSRNVGVIVSDAKIATQLEAIFTKLWESPYVTPIRMH